jgi:hypothetical protein
MTREQREREALSTLADMLPHEEAVILGVKVKRLRMGYRVQGHRGGRLASDAARLIVAAGAYPAERPEARAAPEPAPKPTHEPWDYGPDDEGFPGALRVFHGPTRQSVCARIGSLADARLIVAAHAALSACEALIALVDRSHRQYCYDAELHAVCDEARAAVAKAKP